MEALAAMKAMKTMKRKTYYHNAATRRNSGFKDQATRSNWRKVAATNALKDAKEKVQMLTEKEKKKQARAQRKKEKEQMLTKTVRRRCGDGAEKHA